MSSREAPWKPRSSNNRRAVRSRSARVCSLRSSRVSRGLRTDGFSIPSVLDTSGIGKSSSRTEWPDTLQLIGRCHAVAPPRGRREPLGGAWPHHADLRGGEPGEADIKEIEVTQATVQHPAGEHYDIRG